MNTNAQHYDEHDELYAVIAERDTLRATVQELVAALARVQHLGLYEGDAMSKAEKDAGQLSTDIDSALANARKVLDGAA